MTAPLRIAVDDSAALNQGAGIGRYARNIVPELTKRLIDPAVMLWYAPSQPGTAPFETPTRVAFAGQRAPRLRRGPLSRRRMDQLWFRAGVPLPFRTLAGRSDLVYSPDFTAPPDGRTPRIVTIHDLAFLVRPEFSPKLLRDYLSLIVPKQIASAARVIAVSQTTANDLTERLGVDPDRITVVANGVDARFFGAQRPGQEVTDRLGLPNDYLLIVATLEPRKNHLTLFDALDRMPSTLQLPLVVAGRPGWEFAPILQAMEPLRQRGQVIALDYVPDDVLPSLYAGAAAVIYPSWYEGFGLPVVEAMATGVPVVASDVPALREVGGETIEFTSPGSADEIAEAIVRALTPSSDAASASRARQARAWQFSWGTAGAILAAVVADVTNRPDALRMEKSG